ncbi:hypothetical protein DTW90_31630 [Neorhizobium sp. P12A]|uniref:hypothetical protein n=1 Tax=Neorhizobium sp. P12A TaxID=2268027 RepID=UPI0011F02C6C|nr:hypothetical protein [Neorhizobium sp. P12A]KAA0689451.1 hypothetical protein DTW90_31630 [Neorhizobium sp. P12A]
MTQTSIQPIDRERLLAVIFDLFPWLRAYRHRPVRDYAAAIYDVGAEPASSSRSHARELLCRWIESKALQSGLGRNSAKKMATELEDHPVLQTGPHLHLLIEPDAFFTHLFSLMGLRGRESRSYISYACSTVKFAERSRKGPGWLRLGDQSFNVFGLSRREMIPYSVLARNRAYNFQLAPSDANAGLSHERDTLSRLLPDGQFPCAAEAIKAGNRRLWANYFDEGIDFLQLDDDDVADLVVAHLADPKSWLCDRFLRDKAFPTTTLKTIDLLASTPWRNWLKNSTHFFWGCDDGRIFPMTLIDGFLGPRESQGQWEREGKAIAFTADGLIEALGRRRIIPNLFIVFMVIAILPGVRVLGGSRHTVYYPLMRHAFCSALSDGGRDDDLLRSLHHDRRPGAWGHRVISDQMEPFSILHSPEGNVSNLLSHYGSMSFDEACGSLSSFTEDPLWSDLSAALTTGAASTMRSPWAFN